MMPSFRMGGSSVSGNAFFLFRPVVDDLIHVNDLHETSPHAIPLVSMVWCTWFNQQCDLELFMINHMILLTALAMKHLY